ncbi:MAG TPA: AraC family transcriptional regulator, partial [Acidiphilium sp.]
PVAEDPVLALRFHELFGLLTAPEAGPAIEEYLLRTLMRVARHHAVRPPYRERCAPQVRRVRQYLDEFPEAATSLADLAALAGVSRFQLIRGFARDVGMTPHAYLVQVRLRLVRRLLGTGISPAEAALRAGFADQSHMTRAFVRQFGVTPGRYRAAVI